MNNTAHTSNQPAASGNITMACVDEDFKLRVFARTAVCADGKSEYTCLSCGWMQRNVAEGARELLEHATWPDADTRAAFATRASQVATRYAGPRQGQSWLTLRASAASGLDEDDAPQAEHGLIGRLRQATAFAAALLQR